MDYPSIWQEEKAPQPFAAGTELQRNESKTYEAVIVGAGMCGLLTAYRLLEKGVQSLAIVDAGELAGGVTARTTAKITSQHGLIYDRLLQGLGREKPGLTPRPIRMRWRSSPPCPSSFPVIFSAAHRWFTLRKKRTHRGWNGSCKPLCG